MKNIFTLLIGTLIFFNSNAQITCVDSTLMDTTIWSPCISLYNPVCGCDGITYDNYCFAALLGGNTSYTSGPCSSNPPQTSICENFDSYQNGNLIAATSSNWDLWPSATATDVSVTNLLSSSGSNSLYLFSGTTQGAQDIILPFGTAAPYELGVFEFSSMIYVNTGTGAYFNFQAENIPGNVWSLDCKMDLGALVLENTGSGLNYLTTTYPEEVWFELKLVCDLTNNNWELFLDGNSQGSFTNTINKIASLNLYPIIGHQFYVDDVCFSYIPPLSFNCVNNTCIDPGDGTGTHISLFDCQNACVNSFNCINNTCIDPGDGTGTYISLTSCQTSCNLTSIEENSKIIQLIYPNPANDKIYISNLKEDNTLIKIYDINGRLVLENKISNKEYLNISKLSKGIYQIKFEGSDWNEMRKLIKE